MCIGRRPTGRRFQLVVSCLKRFAVLVTRRGNLMKKLEGKSLFRRAYWPFGMCFFLVLTVAFAPGQLRAQEKADSMPAPCIPSDLASLIVTEGRSVRVDPVREQVRQEARAPETAAAIRSASPGAPPGRAARAASKTFYIDTPPPPPAPPSTLHVSPY